MSATYGERAEALLGGMVEGLTRNKFKPEALEFGGAEDVDARIHVPTHADSKFIAEQALGDWAESALASAIRDLETDFAPIHYGTSSKKMAGDDGFKEEFIVGTKETRLYGKRPDLLLLPEPIQCALDVSSQPILELDEIANAAVASIEVRSSRLEAQTYIRYRTKQTQEGKKVTNPEPSITVKIEDLQKVYRWIERYQIPQIYCQVFFDQVNAINVLEIMEFIAATPKLRIENPARSRKTTIMIPLSNSRVVGKLVSEPDFSVSQQTTLTGRRVIYTVPAGGKIELDELALREALFY